jgi:Fe2+ or Zn2+ uptake regulation protein
MEIINVATVRNNLQFMRFTDEIVKLGMRNSKVRYEKFRTEGGQTRDSKVLM